jgi:hypothetical protein
MPRQTFPHEAVDVPEGAPAISRPVVVGPPFEVTVNLPDQFWQGIKPRFLSIIPRSFSRFRASDFLEGCMFP